MGTKLSNIKKHKYKVNDSWLDGNNMEKDLEILVGYRLSMSFQCDASVTKVNSVLGCINMSITGAGRCTLAIL